MCVCVCICVSVCQWNPGAAKEEFIGRELRRLLRWGKKQRSGTEKPLSTLIQDKKYLRYQVSYKSSSTETL